MSPSFNHTLSISLSHESLHLVVCLRLRLCPGTGVSNILLGTCPSSILLPCPYRLAVFYVIFCDTYTDPLTCSFLIVSVFVTPHIHRSILISFTSSLFSWLFRCRHLSHIMSGPRFAADKSVDHTTAFIISFLVFVPSMAKWKELLPDFMLVIY